MRTDWNLCWSSLSLPRGSVSHRSVCEPPTGFGEDGVGSGENKVGSGGAAFWPAVLSNEASQQTC